MIAQTLFILKKIWDNRILVGIGACAVIVLAFYVYHLRATNTINTLTTENQRLKDMFEQQRQAMEKMREDFGKIIVIRDQLSKEIQTAKQETEELRDKLFRENKGKKSLEELATKKTKLVENAVNRGTEKVLRCFELISEGQSC